MEQAMASKPSSYPTSTIISETKSFQSNNNMNMEVTSQTSVNSSSIALLPKNASHHQQRQGGHNASDIFTPHPHDVLCGRGGLTNNHKGNAWYRRLVSCNRPLYRSSPKHTKLLVSKAIVEAVSSQSPPGRFLERHKKTGLWSRVPYKRAVDKTSQALREKDRVEVEFHVGPHVGSNNNASEGGFSGIGNQQDVHQEKDLQGQSERKMSLQQLALAAVERAGGMPDQIQSSAPPSPSKPCPPVPTPATQPTQQAQNFPSEIPTTFISLSPKGKPVIVPAYSETLARQHQQHNQHSPPTPKHSTIQSLPFPQQPQLQLQQEQRNQIGRPPFQSYKYIQQQPNVDIATTSTNGPATALPPTRAVLSKKHKDDTYPSSPNAEKKPRLLWDHHHSPPTQNQQEQHQAYPSRSEAAQQAGVAVAQLPPPPLTTATSSMYRPLPPMLESLQTRASSLFRFIRDSNIYAGSTADDIAEVTSADKNDRKKSLPPAARQQEQHDNIMTDSASASAETPIHSNENNMGATSKGHKTDVSIGTSSSTSGISDTPLLTEPLQTRASSMFRFLKDSNICTESMANDAATDKNDGKTSLPAPVLQRQQSQQDNMDMGSASASAGTPVHSNDNNMGATGKAHKASGSIGTSSSTSSTTSDAPLLTQLVNVATSEYYLREKDKKKKSHKHHRKQSSSSHNKSDTMSDYDPTQDMPALKNIASASFRQVSSWGMPSAGGGSMSISSASSATSSKSPSPLTAAPSTSTKSIPGPAHHEDHKQILSGVDGEKKVIGITSKTQKAGSSEKCTVKKSGAKKLSLLEDYEESPVEARLRSVFTD